MTSLTFSVKIFFRSDTGELPSAIRDSAESYGATGFDCLGKPVGNNEYLRESGIEFGNPYRRDAFMKSCCLASACIVSVR
jgi:hypothetical protein